jgi:four helix bundle protein
MRQDLLLRTKQFALAVIQLCSQLPNKPEGWVLGKQLQRSGTSIGANYREAQRARSKAEFNSKIHIVQQEIEETVYWLELIKESGTLSAQAVDPLSREAQELRGIFTAIGRNSSSAPASLSP